MFSTIKLNALFFHEINNNERHLCITQMLTVSGLNTTAYLRTIYYFETHRFLYDKLLQQTNICRTCCSVNKKVTKNNLPLLNEEPVLNQQGKPKVHKTKDKHGKDISSGDIPTQWIFENVRTYKARKIS